MARRRFGKKKRSGKRNKAIPVAIVAPLAMPAINYVLPKVMSGDIKGAAQSLALEYAGIGADGKFYPRQLVEAYVPLAMGIVVHKMAGKFGINRYARKYSMGLLEV